MKPRPPLPVQTLRPFAWNVTLDQIRQPIRSGCTADDMETWLVARIAEALGADPLGIDPRLPPSVYGFESAQARALTRDLERRLSRGLRENVFDSDHSVRAVAHLLSRGTKECIATPPVTCDDVRREVLARAVRCPRRPLDAGERPQGGPAGCSPREPSGLGAPNLAAAG